MPLPRGGEAGVVLLNVLVMLALCAGVLVTMLRLSGIGIARSTHFADAARALSVALAGEASAQAALRRDLALAPQADHPGEDWGKVAQEDVAIEGGRFALAIADAQARLNLTGLTGVLAHQRLRSLAAALGLRPEVAQRLALRLAASQPPAGMADLARDAGLTPDELQALAPHVTILPEPAPVNLNTCSDLVLAVMFGNPAIAAALAERRAGQGYLTPDDLAAASAVVPPGAGFVSRFFTVDVAVTSGGARRQVRSLLQRGFGPGDVPVVRVVARGLVP
jgi:general secretion pathway protein K